MNQRTIIYIILSAILLYLYYRRRDLAIFAVFIVVVGATLIFGDRSAEGFSVGGIGGIGGGGGDKVDSACAKLGFTAPKLDKDDLGGSLDKVMKNIKTVAEKHWPYDERGGTNNEKDHVTLDAIKPIAFNEMKLMEGNDEADIGMFGKVITGIYNGKIKAEHILSDTKMMASAMSGGKLLLKIIDKVGKSKAVTDNPNPDDAKKLIVYGRCFLKHWIAIFNKIEGISKGGGGGGDDDGEKKKKKKKTSKKDDDEEEEEKPKKNSKKAKKEEDAEDDE
jgi:hypothetical protein